MRDVRIRENDTHGYPRIIRVKLTEPLSFGAFAEAKRCRYEPDAVADKFLPTDEVVVVYDSMGTISGQIDDKFWAIYKHDSKFHEIIGPVTRAAALLAQVEGEVTSTFDDTDATFTIEVTRLLQDAGQLLDDDDDPLETGATLTIHNRAYTTGYIFSGTSGTSVCLAQWDSVLGRWDAIWVTCQAE